jgi:hypothetical protein
VFPGRVEPAGGFAYHCRICPHRPAVGVELVHRAVLAAVVGRAPRVATGFRGARLGEVLSAVSVTDAGAVAGMVWRPRPGRVSR